MRAFVALLALSCAAITAAQAQAPLFEEIRTVSSVVVPIESASFDIATAGQHDIVLTDLGATLTPAAPVTAIQLAVMRGATVVATLTAAGTTQANLTAGSYIIRVAGEPGPNAGSGLFSASVRATGAAQPVFSFVNTLSPVAATLPNSTRLFQGSVTIAAAGTYTAELVDLAFPQALVTASLAITGGSTLAALKNLPATPQDISTFTATAGATYAIYALGDSGATNNAGLFAIRIRDASTAVVYSQVLAVGRVASLGMTSSLAAGVHALASADLAFPAALAQSGVLVTTPSGAAAAAAGSTSFTVATPGAHEVFALAVAGTNPGAGTLAVEIRAPSAAVVFSAVRTTGGDAASGAQVFAYPVTVVDAGAYTASVADLQFATALSAVNFGVAQGAAVLGRRDSAGSLTGNALVAGRAFLLVFARPAVGTGTLQQTAGLLSAQLATASGTTLFQTTQGVGGVFSARSFQITTTGDYRFTLDDLGFPAAFTELAAAVTRGSERLGLIYGEGSFDVLQATPGSYFINFITRPSATAKAGTYLLSAGGKPPNPTVTLTANPVSPAPGATVVLTWSTQNATSCTASSSWTGARATSGTETSPAITVSSTFALACTGAGGTTTQSLTVAPTAPNTSGGGGGRFDLLTLAALATACAAAGARRRIQPSSASRR